MGKPDVIGVVCADQRGLCLLGMIHVTFGIIWIYLENKCV